MSAACTCLVWVKLVYPLLFLSGTVQSHPTPALWSSRSGLLRGLAPKVMTLPSRDVFCWGRGMKSPSIPEKNGDVSTANHCTLVCRRHPQPVIHEKKSVKNPTCLSETCAKRPIPCATHMRYKTHGYYVGPHSQASTVPVYKQIRQIVCYPSLYRRKCVPSPRASHVPPIASSTLIVTLSWPGHPPLQDRW